MDFLCDVTLKKIMACACFLNIFFFSFQGTRLQAHWGKDEEEDVAAKYEDQTCCLGYHYSLDPHNYLVRLPWLQLYLKDYITIYTYDHFSKLESLFL